MARLFWVSDEAWRRIEPHLPHGQPGKPRLDDRRGISGMLHVLTVGSRGQDILSAYGPHTTVYNCYHRWSQREIWQRLFARIVATGPVPDESMLDASREFRQEIFFHSILPIRYRNFTNGTTKAKTSRLRGAHLSE